MLDLLKGLTRKGRESEVLMRFYGELKKNLEVFHVMDQRQFIDMEFKVDQWQKVQASDFIKPFDKAYVYGQSIEDFNHFYRGFKDYEKWYAADMANKTRENAEKLHTRRSELNQKLKALYPVICRAGEQIEYKLIELGLIKQ